MSLTIRQRRRSPRPRRCVVYALITLRDAHTLGFRFAQAKAAPKAAAKSKAKAEEEEEENELSDAPPLGLELGDLLPEMTVKNEKDEDVNVRELAAKGLVMFVVPKANTRESMPALECHE